MDGSRAQNAESKPFSVAFAEGESSNTAADKQENQSDVNLKTSDGVVFEVKASIAKQMQTVQSFIDTSGDSTTVIPLPNVTSRDLCRILKYCEEHRRIGHDKEALKEFDDNFMKALSHDEMKELLFAANYLNVKEFFDFVCRGIAQMLQNKSVEFARDFFGIVSDFTLEEEVSYREANAWAFENIDDNFPSMAVEDLWKELAEVERKLAEAESKPLSVALAEEQLNSLTLSEGESSNTAAVDEQENQPDVNLKTSDGVAFEVKAWIAKKMETVQSFIDTSGDSSAVIPLPNVTSRDLRRILNYCEEHRRIGFHDKKALKEFDDNFMKALSPDEMKEILLAANYLNMKEFLDFLCCGIAEMLQNKSVEFARDFFGIVSDYTPEEEAAYREANAWAFENIDDNSS
ncbi:uncharacterized protein LOC109787896 [Cajanus cajan]|uniref:uncharacterized protein LOC109787896 n=1 Tax=Cajanus cajan TaxID=3821 RepID=UPI00098DA6BE|nr:uncharacterized protein LOC109787896 [Cajanus cajan]